MPRKVFVTNWIGKIEASQEDVEKFKANYPPTDCVKSNVISNDVIEHPVDLDFGGLGAATFTPSPIPSATNAMYKDKLTWLAIFKDGSNLGQYHNDQEQSSEQIPRDGLCKFCLLKNNNRVAFVRELLPGWRFFYRRRTAMEQGGPIQVIHIVGWQIPTSDDWLTQMAFIYEEDLRVIIGDVAVGKPEPICGSSFPWRHPVEFVPADLEIII